MRLVAGFLQAVIWLVIGPVAAATLGLLLFGADLSPGTIIAATPPAILLGGLPAGLAGLVDRSMLQSHRAPARRVAVAMAIAAGGAAMLIVPAYAMARVHGLYPLLLVLAAAFGAAAAWALSNGLRQLIPPGPNPGLRRDVRS